MSLAAGIKLGLYEIQSPLGAGGMGEVYRARDTRLGRDVALKVLPEAFARDAERLGRFRREAQVLASLNHPNIAAIYGFEDSGATHALVMELVEGPTLAERIKQGAIPIKEALPIAKQIAEALEYAHERGIVHRDLKPANIKLASNDKIAQNDAVKILDFGLAKALEGDASSVDISSSPTITRMATQAGIILGTAAYMSPEQAKGKSVDRRTDIWAFGCVLYEMLTGKQAFTGETVTDTLAAVIMKDPDLSALPANTTQSVRNLLQRCLKKDARQRLQSIGDARVALEDILSGASAQYELAQQDSSAGGMKPPLQMPVSRWRTALPWTIAGLVVAALTVTLIVLWPAPHASKAFPIELTLRIPPDQQLAEDAGPAVVLSSDGTRVAYVTGSATSGRIYIRELDSSEATPLESVQGFAPFFSPDGQWIGFYSLDGKLEKVSVFGGAPVSLCEAIGGRGGSWSKDGTIVFTPGYTMPLYRVSADGGTPVPLTRLDKARHEVTHRWPQVLPDGKAVIFTASSDNNNYEHAYVEAVSLATGQAKVLVQNAYFGRYLPSGYLTYVSGGTLFAAPFDAKDLKMAGTAMPVLPNLQADLTSGGAQLSFSQNGTAAYITGATLSSQVTVALFDRKGVATPLVKQPGDYSSPRFSPDGKRLALQVGTGNISVYDIARGTMTPLTFDNPGCMAPLWTPDGKMIACTRTTDSLGISWLPSDGTGSMKELTGGDGGGYQYPSSWSPDGRTLAFFQFPPKTGGCCEIGTLPVNPNGQAGESKIILGRGGTAAAVYPEISPDGHWMAYESTESGVAQIYVVSFPGLGGKWQISVTNGVFPRWSRAGHELFFIGEGTGTPALFDVPYTVEGNSFEPGKPEALFQGGFVGRDPYSSYDITPDGKHFAAFVGSSGNSSSSAATTVVINWFTRVAQFVQAGQK